MFRCLAVSYQASLSRGLIGYSSFMLVVAACASACSDTQGSTNTAGEMESASAALPKPDPATVTTTMPLATEAMRNPAPAALGETTATVSATPPTDAAATETTQPDAMAADAMLQDAMLQDAALLPMAAPEPSADDLPEITDFGVVDETIVVEAGETYDGEYQRYVAGPALGDGSQDESQDPVFRLEAGAKLINVVLGSPAADGIHVYGDATLENIVWEDVGEDALTIKESGEVILNGGSAQDGEDKIFQINAPSTFRVSNFTADNGGKFVRQNGGTSYEVHVFVNNCILSNLKESIFRTDSETSTLTMSGTRWSNIGEVFRRGDSRDAEWVDLGGNVSLGLR